MGEAYILRKIHGIPDNVWFATLECDIDDYIVATMTKLDIRVYIPDDCYEQSGDSRIHTLSVATARKLARI